jgi:hypothetical protein
MFWRFISLFISLLITLTEASDIPQCIGSISDPFCPIQIGIKPPSQVYKDEFDKCNWAALSGNWPSIWIEDWYQIEQSDKYKRVFAPVAGPSLIRGCYSSGGEEYEIYSAAALFADYCTNMAQPSEMLTVTVPHLPQATVLSIEATTTSGVDYHHLPVMAAITASTASTASQTPWPTTDVAKHPTTAKTSSYVSNLKDSERNSVTTALVPSFVATQTIHATATLNPGPGKPQSPFHFEWTCTGSDKYPDTNLILDECFIFALENNRSIFEFLLTNSSHVGFRYDNNLTQAKIIIGGVVGCVSGLFTWATIIYCLLRTSPKFRRQNRPPEPTLESILFVLLSVQQSLWVIWCNSLQVLLLLVQGKSRTKATAFCVRLRNMIACEMI